MESPRRKPSAKPPAKPYVFRYFSARQRRANDRRAAKRASPEQMAARIPTIGLIDRLRGLIRGAFATARETCTLAQDAFKAGAPPPRANPNLRFVRIMRAALRLVWLSERLEDPKALPIPTPLPPSPSRAERPRSAPAAPATRDPPADADREAAEERRGRADIQRLLRHHTLPEIIAILCRDLGIPADPALWSDAATLAASSPGPDHRPPIPTTAAHQAAPPPIRPGPTTDPPR